MKYKVLVLLCNVLLAFGCANSQSEKEQQLANSEFSKRTKEKAALALDFCKKNNMNTNLCFLLDMNEHSGKNRFVVWDFVSDSAIMKFPVSHGCGRYPWGMDFTKESPSFSNEDGSHLSSLGKYQIGERGYSNWGVHVKYLMHGLESSNKNALKRTIVFHSWEAVTDDEIYPKGTAEGWGCPAISNANFQKVDALLKSSGGKVLMWMYGDECSPDNYRENSDE